ncbi:MAG: ParB N-terminal domain-containing protein, partial [Planctomycetes bacterium]|nr:ParB N-terminal domain-containing protein [Planctomycetota bacterium]
MTLQWIPLDDLLPHPENSNRMPPRLLEKLKGHIQRTGRYEPLVVRPLRIGEVAGGAGDQNESRACPTTAGQASRATEPDGVPPPTPHSALSTPHCRYQILNGHHRAQALRELGHTHARCDVWEVDDAEARLLLATLNRLEGRDDPGLRARL